MTAYAPVRRGGRTAGPRRRVLSGPLFWTLLGLPGLLFLLVAYLVPIGSLLSASFLTPEPGVGNFATVFETSGYTQITWQTIWMSALSTAIAFVLGYPVAYLIVESRHRWVRRGLLLAVVSSQLTSVLSRTFGWQVILGESGPVSRVSRGMGGGPTSLLFTSAATTIGLVQFLLPFMIFPLVTIMQRVNRSTVASVSTLGAGPASRFYRVFMPMTIAGIGVGTILVFVYGVGSYATPAVLGGRRGMMLGVVIRDTLDNLGDTGLAAALAMLLLVAVGVAVAVYQGLLRGRMEWLLNPETAPTATARLRLSRIPFLAWLRGGMSTVAAAIARLFDSSGVSSWKWPRAVLGVAVVIFLTGPQIVTAVVSFSGSQSLLFPPKSWSLTWYRNFFSPAWLEPTMTSVIVGVCAAALATVLAGLAAIAVARGGSRIVRAVITIAMLLPLIVPSVVTAAAYYVFLLPLGLTDTRTGLVIAHTSLLLPFAFGIILANIQSVNRTAETAAVSLGAGPARVLRSVLLPQIYSGLLVAFLLGFLISFDEAVVGIFLSDIYVQTLPAHMFAAISQQSDPTIGVVGTLMIAVVAIVYGIFGLFRPGRRADTDQDEVVR